MPSNLLHRVNSPADVRALSRSELKTLAQELREFVLQSVSQTGGHLGSNLGTVELTVALHYVFNTPHDRLVWDVGHQTYPHKVLTGRRDRMPTLAPAGRHRRLSAPRRKRVRRLRHRAFVHLAYRRCWAWHWPRKPSRARTGKCVAIIGDGAHDRRHGLRGA